MHVQAQRRELTKPLIGFWCTSSFAPKCRASRVTRTCQEDGSL